MLCSFDGGGIMSSRRYDDIVMTSIWRVTEICFYFTKKIAVSAEKHRFSYFSGKFFYQWFEPFTLQKWKLNWILSIELIYFIFI